MLSVVVMCAALAACQSSVLDSSTWDNIDEPWLDNSWGEKDVVVRRTEPLSAWQKDKLKDYKDLFPTRNVDILGVRDDLFSASDRPWQKIQSAVSTPFGRYEHLSFPRGDDVIPSHRSALDDNLFSSLRPARLQRDDDDADNVFRFPYRRSHLGDDLAVEPVVPFSRDFADRAYRSQVWRVPNRLAEVRGYGQSFEDHVSDYYSSRRQYAFNLVSEVLRFCDCRETRARMKLWWGGVFTYDVAVYRDAVAAETVYDDLGFQGQFVREDIRHVVRGAIPSPTAVREFRGRFLKGLLDTMCDSAKSYVADVQTFVEATHPLRSVETVRSFRPALLP